MLSPKVAVLWLGGAILAQGALRASGLGQGRPDPLEGLPVWNESSVKKANRSGQFVFRDGGSIVISYPESLALPSPSPSMARRITVRWDLQNKVEPQILCDVARLPDRSYQYTYALENGSGAKYPIQMWALVAPVEDPSLHIRHYSRKGTRGSPGTARQAEIPGAAVGGFAMWYLQPAIPPGESHRGFIITSSYKPGLTTTYSGGGPPLALPTELPAEFSPEIARIQRPEVMWKTGVIIGPRFPPQLSAAQVAAYYERDLRAVLELGSVHLRPEFVRSFLEDLQRIRNGQELGLSRISQVARTPFEKELAHAAAVALEK